jgi:hypothetical protein
MLEVVTANSWEKMRWDRIPSLAANWHVKVVDTTDRTPDDVSDHVLAWIRSAIAGDAQTLRVAATPHPTT